MFELFHNLTLSNKKNLRSKPFAGESKKAHNHLGYLGGFKVNEPKMSSELIYFKHKEKRMAGETTSFCLLAGFQNFLVSI